MKRIDIKKDYRMAESRIILKRAFNIALGSYIEQEAKKEDRWREQSFGELYAHLRHEIEEIRRSKSRTGQLHNAIDACILSGMLIAKLLEGEENGR